MQVTERTLKKWRKEALKSQEMILKFPGDNHSFSHSASKEYCDRVLRMTQELLDQHLLRKG